MKTVDVNVKIESNIDEYKTLLKELEMAVEKVNNFKLEFEVIQEKE